MGTGKTKILVIDDHRETRELIAQLLRKNSFEVILAPGGREGVQIAKFKKPDMILLDMNMPFYNGIQTCKVLKRHPVTKKIPVIFLTASRDSDDVKGAMLAGGVDYIAKPFDPDNMLSRINNQLGSTGFDPSDIIK